MCVAASSTVIYCIATSSAGAVTVVLLVLVLEPPQAVKLPRTITTLNVKAKILFILSSPLCFNFCFNSNKYHVLIV